MWSFRELWGGNTRRWCEGLLFSRAWRLPTPPLPLFPALVTHLFVARFILHVNMTSYVSDVPEYSPLIYWVIKHGVGYWELSNFRHFVKSGVTWDNMAGIWTRTVLSPQLGTIYTHSLDLMSELNWLLSQPVGIWRNCILFLEIPQIWCEGKPDSLSLCFGSSGESWGQGSNEGGTLHPGPLSIYRYFRVPGQIG